MRLYTQKCIIYFLRTSCVHPLLSVFPDSSVLHISYVLTLFVNRTVTISNRSNILVSFKWTKYATLREELQQKER